MLFIYRNFATRYANIFSQQDLEKRKEYDIFSNLNSQLTFKLLNQDKKMP